MSIHSSVTFSHITGRTSTTGLCEIWLTLQASNSCCYNCDILQQICINQNKDKALKGIMRYETPPPTTIPQLNVAGEAELWGVGLETVAVFQYHVQCGDKERTSGSSPKASCHNTSAIAFLCTDVTWNTADERPSERDANHVFCCSDSNCCFSFWMT